MNASGTARAMEMSALEGAISGLAIGIIGIMTALLIPFADRLFKNNTHPNDILHQ